MNNAHGRCVFQSGSDLQGVVDRIGNRDAVLTANQFPNRRTGDELECDEMQSPFFANVMHTSDVFVIESCSGSRFVLEPFNGPFIVCLSRSQQFQRHQALQTGVNCAKDGTHPSHADPLFNAEVIQFDAGGAVSPNARTGILLLRREETVKNFPRC